MKNIVGDFEKMLTHYASSSPARFHMPGHKGLLGSPLDVTELSATDNLHSPQNAITALEENFAKAYQARHSFLLVNGSTSGIHAFLLALGTNKTIIVSRECHRSIIHGAALCDDEVIFTPAQSASDIETALKTAPSVDAVILTSPDYYGRCADIERIADIVHSHNALLFVDSAHGAHFPFCDELPRFPHEKVDMWCVSAHKTLDALTQSAILNLGSCCPFSVEQIRNVLMLENTSSPSFLLMLSLEKALFNAQSGAWKAHVNRIKAVKERILYTFDDITPDSFENSDITRLCLDVSRTGNTGYEVALFLEKSNIFCECANETHIILITTPSDLDEWYERLIFALASLERKPVNSSLFTAVPMSAGHFSMSIRKAMFSEVEYVPLEKCAGRISAVCLGIYPPGSPLVAPGEKMLAETVDYLVKHEEFFSDTYGTVNGCVPCVK